MSSTKTGKRSLRGWLTRAAVFIAAVVGSVALFITNLASIKDAIVKTFARNPATIEVQEARGMFAWVMGPAGEQRGRGYSFGGVEVEVVASKNGEAAATNCKAELMFNASVAFPDSKIETSDKPSFDFLEAGPTQRKYVFEFQVPAYLYDPEAGKLRILCDGIISKSVAVALPNMLHAAP
jgi:hypothetical protein